MIWISEFFSGKPSPGLPLAKEFWWAFFSLSVFCHLCHSSVKALWLKRSLSWNLLGCSWQIILQTHCFPVSLYFVSLSVWCELLLDVNCVSWGSIIEKHKTPFNLKHFAAVLKMCVGEVGILRGGTAVLKERCRLAPRGCQVKDRQGFSASGLWLNLAI